MVEYSLRSHCFCQLMAQKSYHTADVELKNLQLHVGGDPAWLDGRYVRADHFGLGMLIGKVAETVSKNITTSKQSTYIAQIPIHQPYEYVFGSKVAVSYLFQCRHQGQT